MLHATKKPILLALLIVLGSIAGCIGNDEEKTELETLTVAFEVKDDYTNVDENPQKFADYLANELNMKAMSAFPNRRASRIAPSESIG